MKGVFRLSTRCVLNKSKRNRIAMGYRRPDGGIGIRNKVLILYTVSCISPIARRIHSHFRNSDIDVDLFGCEGCATTPLMQRKLIAFGTHQNVGSVLLLSNGCEETNVEQIKEEIMATGRHVLHVCIQEEVDMNKAVRAGIQSIQRLYETHSQVEMVPLCFSDLIIGVECGGSDFTSGLAVNPLVGDCVDYIISLGGTVLFEEMNEAIGLKSLLLSRCASEHAKYEIELTYDKFLKHSIDSGQFAISPGNIRGGLTTIEEKSMGAFIKSGNALIQGVLKLCQKPPHPGLWYVDMLPDLEYESGFHISADAGSTLLYQTCGAHLTILTSGLGHVVNNPIAPMIKITGNSRTFATMQGDFDLDAGMIISGQQDREELLNGLIDLITQVVDGRKTCGEVLGHAEYMLNYENQFDAVLTGINKGAAIHE